MPAIDFPNSPVLNDEFSANGKTWIYNGTTWDLRQSSPSKSAYEAALDTGFVGTEAEWIASLRGKFIVSDTAPTPAFAGDSWFSSTTGRMYTYYDNVWVEIGGSVAGLSAYDLAVSNGFVGTEAEWLASLSQSSTGKAIAMAIVFG